VRFDLQLSFNRIGEVHAQKGYQGPVVVCGVQFAPLTGYVPERPSIKYLVARRDIETWLAPIPGTRIAVPPCALAFVHPTLSRRGRAHIVPGFPPFRDVRDDEKPLIFRNFWLAEDAV